MAERGFISERVRKVKKWCHWYATEGRIEGAYQCGLGVMRWFFFALDSASIF